MRYIRSKNFDKRTEISIFFPRLFLFQHVKFSRVEHVNACSIFFHNKKKKTDIVVKDDFKQFYGSRVAKQ